jgi:hypothetical protein
MNWRLISQLSLFGLAMGIATVFVISSTVEPICWLIIFIISAYAIARRTVDRRFLHGVLTGLANSVWVTAAHMAFFDAYIANHAREAAVMSSMPLPTHPRVMMALTGPVIGLISGIILGIFALVASKFVRPRADAPAPAAR